MSDVCIVVMLMNERDKRHRGIREGEEGNECETRVCMQMNEFEIEKKGREGGEKQLISASNCMYYTERKRNDIPLPRTYMYAYVSVVYVHISTKCIRKYIHAHAYIDIYASIYLLAIINIYRRYLGCKCAKDICITYIVVCICARARARIWIGGCDLLRASTDLYVSICVLVYLLTHPPTYTRLHTHTYKRIFHKYIYTIYIYYIYVYLYKDKKR